MLRSLPVWLALLLSFGLVADATGKVALQAAEVCGASECSTRTAQAPGDLPFELLGPTIEAGRRAAPRDSTGPNYRITLTTQAVPGNEVIRLQYFPDSRFLHILGQPRSEAGGALLNTGWVRLRPLEAHAYDALTVGLTPRDPRGDVRQSPSWEIPVAAAGLLALGAIGLIVARRRRAAAVTPAPS